MTALSEWENFYVIAGSSAGALIGLQFVVLTLIASRPVGAGTAQAGHAFATPTIVHFGAVLLLAGMLSAPWQAITPAAVLWGLLGLSGIVYAAVVVRRMRRQTTTAEYTIRSEEHTSELQSQSNLVCRVLLEKEKRHQLLDLDFLRSDHAR